MANRLTAKTVAELVEGWSQDFRVFQHPVKANLRNLASRIGFLPDGAIADCSLTNGARITP
jgi:hypothetical protein